MINPVIGAPTKNVGSYALYCTECKRTFLHTQQGPGETIVCSGCQDEAPLRVVLRRPPVKPEVTDAKPVVRPRETTIAGFSVVEIWHQPYLLQVHATNSRFDMDLAEQVKRGVPVLQVLQHVITTLVEDEYTGMVTCVMLGSAAFDLLVADGKN